MTFIITRQRDINDYSWPTGSLFYDMFEFYQTNKGIAIFKTWYSQHSDSERSEFIEWYLKEKLDIVAYVIIEIIDEPRKELYSRYTFILNNENDYIKMLCLI